MGSDPGAVETARLSGVDPIAYLVETATRTKREAGDVLQPEDFRAAA
jgi:hypothetical protein